VGLLIGNSLNHSSGVFDPFHERLIAADILETAGRSLGRFYSAVSNLSYPMIRAAIGLILLIHGLSKLRAGFPDLANWLTMGWIRRGFLRFWRSC
jgi:hypothetical protein